MTITRQLLIKKHLITSYPNIAAYIDKAQLQERLIKSDYQIGDAVVKVITGQMLSRAAASTIYNRLVSTSKEFGLKGTWELPTEVMFSCGLSKSKCRAISEFSEDYMANAESIEQWPNLKIEELYKRVCSYWGMSDWTASILSIFHFGHEDVFPYKDGSIIRVLSKLGYESKDFNPQPAAPYRSYLAMYLWSILDNKIST